MKKIFFVITICLMLVAFTGTVFAQDVFLEKEIKSVTIKKDKNGNEYVRFIVSDKATLNGVSYSKDASVMCFGDNVAKAKLFKKGQTLKAIVDKGSYKGRTSYTVIEIAS